MARPLIGVHVDQGHLNQQPQKRFALKGRKSTRWALLALSKEAGMSSCHEQVCLRHVDLERLMWHFLEVVGVLTKWLQRENSPIHRPRQEEHLPFRVRMARSSSLAWHTPYQRLSTAAQAAEEQDGQGPQSAALPGCPVGPSSCPISQPAGKRSIAFWKSNWLPGSLEGLRKLPGGGLGTQDT